MRDAATCSFAKHGAAPLKIGEALVLLGVAACSDVPRMKVDAETDDMAVRQAMIGWQRGDDETVFRLADKTIPFEFQTVDYLQCSLEITEQDLQSASYGQRLNREAVGHESVQFVDAGAQLARITEAWSIGGEIAANALGYWQLTPVLFNGDRSQAVVGIARMCGPACVYEDITLLAREGSTWTATINPCTHPKDR